MAISDDRPLRRDAERNRSLLLAAARELFAERGLEVTMDQIAARAGVGVGTVYRRFGSRDEIIEALFEDRMEQVAALAESALRDDDAWAGLSGFLERLIEMQAADRGLKELLVSHVHHCQRVGAARERVIPIIERLVHRARESGQLRADASDTDIAPIIVMLGAVADFSQDVQPDLWRRYLAIVLDGLRPTGAPLPVEPLDMARLETAMDTWRPFRPRSARPR
jgi:AcrR family transcriptional regulator